MARTYRVTRSVRVSNLLTATMLRLGLSFNGMVLLTVPGRKSGAPRTVPVSVIERDGERYLIGSFGEVNWVRNLRAAGGGTLRKGRRIEPFTAKELPAAEAAPVLKDVLATAPGFVRAHFDVTAASPLVAVEREASRHPVFRLTVGVPVR